MDTAADSIVQRLIDHGVDTIFGIPGAQTYALFDALAKRKSSIALYTTRHEQGAAYMAYGYAKSTGRPGVYCVVPGPGALFLMLPPASLPVFACAWEACQ